MKRALPLLLTAMLSMSQVALAQRSAAAVSMGTRVKLFVVDTLRDGSGVQRFSYPAGTIIAFEKDSLILRSDSSTRTPPGVADTLRVPVTNIGSAEAYAGMQRHPVQGGVLGLAFGAAVGIVVGDHAAARVECGQVAGISYCSRVARYPESRSRDAAMFGGLAGVAGAAIGYFVKTERWSRIDIGRLRLQVGLQP